ncbi:pleckstrin homology domain-containing family A member 6 [Morphnus guianensis]
MDAVPPFPQNLVLPFLWLEKSPALLRPFSGDGMGLPRPPWVLIAPLLVFHSDETKSTSWVHPGTGYSIQSGHFSCAGLPRGWEVDTTLHGGFYFINHNERRNTFLHPVTGQVPEDNSRLDLQKPTLDMSSKAGSKRPATITSEPSNHAMVSEVPPERPGGRASRSSRKGIAFGKRSNSMKRNPNAAVTKSGWLYKQASSGVKQWNKRWFVLVDRCLFYYKDEKEESILGSIPLLSFRVAAVQPSDNISRKHTFKAEHAGIRTYFFSAENTEEQESWIQAMGEAARVQIPPTQRSAPADSPHEKPDSENIPPSKHHQHHCNATHREHPRADPDAKTRGEGDGRGSEKIERKSERMESKKEPLAKANGIAGQEMPSEPSSPYPEAPRVPASVERPPQPNGWPYSSPSRPGSTAYPPPDGESVAHRRGFAPRTNPEKIAQRKSSMTQLQQWVNSRRGAVPPEELRSPTRFYPVSRRVPDYYSPYSPQYPEDYQYYPPGVRPDSICSMPAYERVSPPWALEDKRHSFRNGGTYQLRDWKEHPGFGRQDVPLWLPGPGRQPTYLDEMDATSGSLRRMSLQPRSRSVPRSPSQGSYSRARVYSPVRSPSARFERLPPRGEEIYADPTTFMMRRSISSPKVTPFPEAYRETLHAYKISEQDTDKLLGKLCEQNKVLREQERLVQQLRAEKESLESALMGTHQELEMFGSQPAYPEKLLHKKESLQNQLINIRVELSQASTALANSTAEYETLESEVSALHDDLWEQLNLDIQNEMLNRQIQKEIWRIQDVMEGLRKNNPSRGTDTAKHRVAIGPSGTYSSNSPASPLSSASLTSPLSPFSLVSGSQGSPTKPGPSEEPGPPRPPLPKSYVPLESPPTVPPLPGESRLWPYPTSPSWQQGGEAKRGQVPKPLQSSPAAAAPSSSSPRHQLAGAGTRQAMGLPTLCPPSAGRTGTGSSSAAPEIAAAPEAAAAPGISPSAFLCPRLSRCPSVAPLPTMQYWQALPMGVTPPNSCPPRENPDLGIPGNAVAVLPLGEGARFGHQETQASSQPGGQDACTWGLAQQSSGRAGLGRVTDPSVSASGISSSRAAAGWHSPDPRGVRGGARWAPQLIAEPLHCTNTTAAVPGPWAGCAQWVQEGQDPENGPLLALCCCTVSALTSAPVGPHPLLRARDLAGAQHRARVSRPGAPGCHLRAVTGSSPLREAFPMQEPVLWGQQSVLNPDGPGQELQSPASPSPRMFGVRWYRLASVCVSVRSRECVQRLYVTPRAAESSGSVPRQSMTPRRDGVLPGTCFPPQPKPSFEQSKKEVQRPAAPGPPAEGLLQSRQEPEAEKQAALNKVGIVPPRTKSPAEEEVVPTVGVPRRSAGGMANGLSSRERPKSAVFANETKVKMSVEEQIDRMKRHQSGSMKEKRRSLQLPGSQQPDTPGTKAPTSYKVVRRHRSIHEVDISDLEAALRSDDPGKVYETPQEEIARLRKMELEPQHYDVDINKELSTPDKVLIPERYIELEPDTPLSPEEMKEKQKKVERIKTLIAKSSLQNVIPLGEGEVDTPQDPETQLQEQEKRIEISCALAAEASRRGRMLSAQCATPSPPTSPASPTPPTNPLSSETSRVADNSHFMRV